MLCLSSVLLSAYWLRDRHDGDIVALRSNSSYSSQLDDMRRALLSARLHLHDGVKRRANFEIKFVNRSSLLYYFVMCVKKPNDNVVSVAQYVIIWVI